MLKLRWVALALCEADARSPPRHVIDISERSNAPPRTSTNRPLRRLWHHLQPSRLPSAGFQQKTEGIPTGAGGMGSLQFEAERFIVRHHINALLTNALSHRDTLFWPIWSSLTAASAICTAWVFRSSPILAIREEKGSRKAQLHWSRTKMIPLAMLTLFLGAYVAMILVGEDFAMYDNAQFTAFSIRGVNLPILMWPQGGRFFPLSLQEFNLIGRFTRTIAGYHAFSILELVLLVLVLLNLDNQLRIASRAALTVFALVTPGVVLSFSALIYSERNILVLLACLALLIRLFERTHSTHLAVAAVVLGQVMLYLKEPVFLLLLGFTAARLVLRRWSSGSARWTFQRPLDEDDRLDLCIAAASMGFVAFYAFMMFPHTGGEYLVERHLSLAATARYYVKVDLLAWILAVVAMARMYGILRGRIAPLLLWDGLACGGLVYFGAYLRLGLAHSYYLAPVDLIAVLYLGHLLCSSWGELRLGARALAIGLAVIVASQSLELSTYHVLERKFFIRQKAAIARLILETYQREQGSALNLYFPLTDPYMLSEFAAYLSYRGLPVEEQAGDEPVPAGRVRIFAAKTAEDGKCVSWRPFVCHAGAGEAARFVIVLPDDPVLPEEVTLYREFERRLHSYDSRIRPPGWLSTALSFMWIPRPK